MGYGAVVGTYIRGICSLGYIGISIGNKKLYKMKKWKPWEYYIVRSTDITPERLQALGDNGWQFKFGYNDNTELVFAREKRIVTHFK